MTSLVSSASSASASTSTLVYFGTYTRAKSQGIYVARFDAATGALSTPELAAAGANPTFLAVHPTRAIVYAIGEEMRDGGAYGIVRAFSVDRADGRLSRINQLAVPGSNACYVAVDPTGRMLVTANYGGGFVTAFSLRDDGSLGAQTAMHKHTGTGPHKQQDAPHAHCIDFDPTNRWAFSADLSADKIFGYRVDAASASLEPRAPVAAGSVKPGAGPRHLAFHPNGKFIYVTNELVSTVTVFAYDAASGALTEIETVDAVPADFSGRRWGSEIAVHPSGNFLYTSNRADHESLAVFAVDAKTGRLTLVQHVRDGIKHPRHFAIFPDGRWLLCANHDADDALVFGIDAASGRLTPTGTRVTVPSAVCIVFVR